MRKVVISDASCLIALDNIGELDVIHQLYGEVLTTSTVAAEFGKKLPNWIEIQNPTDALLLGVIESTVDEGEASAIALAVEIKFCTLILDDLAARKYAERLKIEITGTLGVLVKAKKSGIVSALKPLIEKLRSVNFRISAKIEAAILEEVGEPF